MSSNLQTQSIVFRLSRDSDFWAENILAVDGLGVPIIFSDAVFTIHPDSGNPVSWTTADYITLDTTFQWREDWVSGYTYHAGDVVSYGGDMWISLTTNANMIPGSSGDWGPFAQIVFNVPASVIAGYDFDTANYCISVTYTNGKVDGSWMTGKLRVNGPCQ